MENQRNTRVFKPEDMSLLSSRSQERLPWSSIEFDSTIVSHLMHFFESAQNDFSDNQSLIRNLLRWTTLHLSPDDKGHYLPIKLQIPSDSQEREKFLYHLRFFLDAFREMLFLQSLYQDNIPANIDVYGLITNLVNSRSASKSLGYYREGNQGEGAYFDDKNLYVYYSSDKTEIGILSFLKQTLKKLDSQLADMHNLSFQKFINILKKRALLKLLFAGIKLSIFPIPQSLL